MERLNAHITDLNVGLKNVNRNLARGSRSLRGSSDQLKVLAGGMLDMQEAERRILAYELHEELGQSLAAVVMNLKSPERSAIQQNQDLDNQAIQMVVDALQQVRRLAHALRPAVLDDLGLVPALRWLAQKTQTRSALEIQVTATTSPVRLESRLETVCFRVVEEALSNVVRHAAATTVAILLEQGSDYLLLRVHDNGNGFDPSLVGDYLAAHGAIGLLSVQERVSNVGGEFDIKSSPGAGTTLSLRCALAPTT